MLATAAQAAPILYDISGTASGGGFNDSFAGSFTYDPSTLTLSAPTSIVVTGDFGPGTYNIPHNVANGGAELDVKDAAGDTLSLFFVSALGSSVDPLSIVDIALANGSLFGFSEVTGQAAPVPEPASMAIFGAALAAFGLIRRRRVL
jgi:hypothetical protein